MIAKLTCSLALLVALSHSVRANELVYNTTTGPIAVGGSAIVSVPKLDPSLGVLRTVRINVFGTVSGSWGVENTSNGPDHVGDIAGSQYVGAILPIQLPAGFIFGPNPAFQPPTTQLTAFDGALDYAGTSGVTFTFTNAAGDGGPAQETTLFTDAVLGAYTGTGNATITVGPVIAMNSSISPNLQSIVSIAANMSIQVRLGYEVWPAQICNAASLSGCPCNNSSSIVSGGCANSVNPMGGKLDALGTASLSNDSLVLAGSRMTHSSALYFQGSTFGFVQTVYGDGLRCVGGSIVRLGTKINASGTSQYPVAGDVPVSVRGNVTVPGLRYYQVVYRDNGNFCTSSAFNVTSGVAVQWTP
jgi:hypothetical protein